MQYRQDFNDQLPTGPLMNGFNKRRMVAGVGWANPTYPYFKSVQGYTCPQDKTRSLLPLCSYALNSNLVSGPKPKPLARLARPDRTILLADVAGVGTDVFQPYNPANGEGDGYSAAGNGKWGDGLYPTFGLDAKSADMAALWDTGPMMTAPEGTRQTSPQALELLQKSLGPLKALPEISGKGRHDGAAFYVFVDGHIKLLPGSSVSNGADARKPGDPPNEELGLAQGTSDPLCLATFSSR